MYLWYIRSIEATASCTVNGFWNDKTDNSIFSHGEQQTQTRKVLFFILSAYDGKVLVDVMTRTTFIFVGYMFPINLLQWFIELNVWCVSSVHANIMIFLDRSNNNNFLCIYSKTNFINMRPYSKRQTGTTIAKDVNGHH